MHAYLYEMTTDSRSGFIATLVKSFLFALSLIYGVLVRVLIFLRQRKPRTLNCKVISIGNITLGGTGKTTLVEYVAERLKPWGVKSAVLTRGYGRGTVHCQGHASQYERMGDEPYMLQRRLKSIPVIVDADRIRGAGRAIKEYGADTVILDDGFQQWGMKKDLEIVTIDSTKPFGNRHMLPRGILREPLSSLRRADIFVLTKTDRSLGLDALKTALTRLNPKALLVESIHTAAGFYDTRKRDELLPVTQVKAQTVALFSGIGDPDSFEAVIKSLGFTVGLSFRFPDHHAYSEENLSSIVRRTADTHIDTLITTEKDAVRLECLQEKEFRVPILVLRIELVIKDEQRFLNRLHRLYSL